MADRIKAKMLAGGVAEVSCLMNHPMETGLVIDKATGKPIPAHHITSVTMTVGGKTVMQAQWGGAVSKNPYLQIKVAGAKSGDAVNLSWVDNKGEKSSTDATIS